MKYQVNFVDKENKVFHRLVVEARDKREVCRIVKRDTLIRKQLQEALQGRGGEANFYIYPAKDLS